MRSLIANTPAESSLTAASATLGLVTALGLFGTTLSEAYLDFSNQNLRGVPQNLASNNLIQMEEPNLWSTTAIGLDSPGSSTSVLVNHLATQYMRFSSDAGHCARGTLTVNVDVPVGLSTQPKFAYGSQYGSASTVVALNRSGNTFSASMPWDTCAPTNRYGWLSLNNGSHSGSELDGATIIARTEATLAAYSETPAPGPSPAPGGVGTPGAGSSGGSSTGSAPVSPTASSPVAGSHAGTPYGVSDAGVGAPSTNTGAKCAVSVQGGDQTLRNGLLLGGRLRLFSTFSSSSQKIVVSNQVQLKSGQRLRTQLSASQAKRRVKFVSFSLDGKGFWKDKSYPYSAKMPASAATGNPHVLLIKAVSRKRSKSGRTVTQTLRFASPTVC